MGPSVSWQTDLSQDFLFPDQNRCSHTTYVSGHSISVCSYSVVNIYVLGLELWSVKHIWRIAGWLSENELALDCYMLHWCVVSAPCCSWLNSPPSKQGLLIQGLCCFPSSLQESTTFVFFSLSTNNCGLDLILDPWKCLIPQASSVLHESTTKYPVYDLTLLLQRMLTGMIDNLQTSVESAYCVYYYMS